MADYLYICEKCGKQSELRKRVTRKKRFCDHCGNEITTEAIDRTMAILETERKLRAEAADRATSGLLSPILMLLALGLCIAAFVGFWRYEPSTPDYSERFYFLVASAVGLALFLWLAIRYWSFLATSSRK